MPPKGWRKNAEGQYPLQKQDLDLVSIDDILFPRATVQKLAKALLNSSEGETESNSVMAKDSVIALQRSATVFVSHLLFHARKISKDNSRKTVNAQDILAAIERADFPGFLPEVKQKLATFEQNNLQKKKDKKVKQEGEKDELVLQSAKRLKDNESHAQIKPEQGEEEEEEEIEEDEAENDGQAEGNSRNEEDDPEDDDGEEEEDEDEAVRTQNPIALLEREEKELNQDGEEGEENVENQQEDDDGDSDDDNDQAGNKRP